MKNKKILQFLIINILTSPLKLISFILGIVGVLIIRSVAYSKKINNVLEKLEKAKKKS